MIRPMTKQDITPGSANIIYQTDPELFPFLFGPSADALPRLQTLMHLKHNSFSHRHGLVDHQAGDVRGVLMAYAPNRINNELETRDFKRAFHGPAQLMLQFKAWIVEWFSDKKSMGEYYIQNICVSPDHRGKGIGTALLKDCIERCRRDGIKQVSLDVVPENQGAYRLYTRLGFKKIKGLHIPLLGEKAHRLQLEPIA